MMKCFFSPFGVIIKEKKGEKETRRGREQGRGKVKGKRRGGGLTYLCNLIVVDMVLLLLL